MKRRRLCGIENKEFIGFFCTLLENHQGGHLFNIIELEEDE
jgi:hypothetical protein